MLNNGFCKFVFLRGLGIGSIYVRLPSTRRFLACLPNILFTSNSICNNVYGAVSCHAIGPRDIKPLVAAPVPRILMPVVLVGG